MANVTRLFNKLTTWARQHWLLLLGFAAIAPLAAVDPYLVFLLFDVEFLALIGTVGVRMLREDLEIAFFALLATLVIVQLRVGWQMTRERPSSLFVVASPGEFDTALRTWSEREFPT